MILEEVEMKVLLWIFLAAALATSALADDLSGKWSGTFTQTGADGQSQSGSAYLVLKQSGKEVTGTGGGSESEQWPFEKARFESNEFTGQVHDSDGMTYALDLTLQGDHLKGDVTITTPGGQILKGKVDVARVK
jgi:opacity protein-like surface antigen